MEGQVVMEGRVSNADQKTKKQTLFRGQKKITSNNMKRKRK